MRKVAELLKIYFMNKLRRPLTVAMSLLWALAFFVFLYFVFETGGLSFGKEGFSNSFVASYLVFVPAYIGVFGVLHGVLEDSDSGLLKAYRGTRMEKYEYFTAKIAASSVSGLAVAALILGLASYLSPVTVSLPLAFMAVLATVVAHSGIALVTASLSKDTQESRMVVQTFVIVLIAGTPVFYPETLLPGSVRILQQLIPLTHSIELSRALVQQQATAGFIIEKTAVLVGFSAVLIGAAYRRFDF
ncbi:MAG: ABC transporter permease [Candidatus Nanohaloarchaea archaeon]